MVEKLIWSIIAGILAMVWIWFYTLADNEHLRAALIVFSIAATALILRPSGKGGPDHV